MPDPRVVPGLEVALQMARARAWERSPDPTPEGFPTFAQTCDLFDTLTGDDQRIALGCLGYLAVNGLLHLAHQNPAMLHLFLPRPPDDGMVAVIVDELVLQLVAEYVQEAHQHPSQD